jgi:hypothetical protein
MMDFVSWDDDSIPSFWKVNPNSMVPNITNQVFFGSIDIPQL